jgi:hypothetical protein
LYKTDDVTSWRLWSPPLLPQHLRHITIVFFFYLMAAHIVEQANTFTQIRGPPFLVFWGYFFSYLDDKKIVMENNSNRLLTFGRRPDFHSAGQAKTPDPQRPFLYKNNNNKINPNE